MKEEIRKVLQYYSQDITDRLSELRQLIIAVANEENVAGFEECLKWGQISYISQFGSTVRIGSFGDEGRKIALYCHCQSKLIDTFRELYADRLSFDGNRAIVFSIDQPLPAEDVKNCISVAFNYHRVKHLPLLGA